MAIAALSFTTFAQLDGIAKGRAKDMLDAVAKEVKKKYYDENLKGIDLDARVKAAKERINDAQSLAQAFGIIGQVFLDFDDSHTIFFPPARAIKFEYGWQVEMIGDKCVLTAVRPGSDAAKKGLKTGDEVLSINGFKPNRNELWKMVYFYYNISPRAEMSLVVKSPSGETRQVVSKTKTEKLTRFINLGNSIDWNEYYRTISDESRVYEHRWVSNSGLVIWKMPTFSFDPNKVNDYFDSHVKGNHSLILDLRGNGGGYVVTMEKMVANLFESDLKIADLKRREDSDDDDDVMESESRGSDAYTGKLVILIDSGSGSASEILARFVQLKKRGTIIGDTSAGAVMQAIPTSFTMGVNTVIAYGARITNADVILEDGKSLEKVGVTPDIVVIPEPADLAYERDPVLSRAAKELGFEITPEQAGGFFPVVWNDGKKGNVTYKAQ